MLKMILGSVLRSYFCPLCSGSHLVHKIEGFDGRVVQVGECVCPEYFNIRMYFGNVLWEKNCFKKPMINKLYKRTRWEMISLKGPLEHGSLQLQSKLFNPHWKSGLWSKCTRLSAVGKYKIRTTAIACCV